MRSFIVGLALVLTVSGLEAPTSYAANGNENRAQRIARNLKQSGMLKDYRVAVKYNDGVALLSGTVTSPRQKQLAEQIARSSAGVRQVVSKLEVEGYGAELGRVSDQNFTVASNTRINVPQRAQRAPVQRRPQRSARSNMPVPYARAGIQPAAYSRQAQYCPDGSCMTRAGLGGPGGAGGMGMRPAPMGSGAPTAIGQSVSYDNPQMPGYAWPSYAASPNYAALTYPKQYSASAWPYIGPFYPYPQVPLGWRKVTLEWDDGWWFLDFKDCKHCK